MTPPSRFAAVADDHGPSLTGTVCLANARLVLADHVMTGQITVTDGRIAEISPRGDIPVGAIDCEGDYVIPGLIELHTDNLERHIEPRPRVNWPHLPALVAHDAELASTGITTVFDALRVGSIHDKTARYKKYARGLADELLAAGAAGVFKISHFLHLRAEVCSETLLEELAEFSTDDRVGIVSLMDHTPGQRQFRDLDVLRNYVMKKRGMSDAEFTDHVANLYRLRDQNGETHERGAVTEAARLGAVLASHDDTTPAHVNTSRENGVSFAEFPTTIAAAQACRENGIAVMMGAPNLVRGGSHSGNVSARDLAQAGLLDIISSDYVPAALLLSAFQVAAIWDDIPRAVACVTKAPAQATGLTDRGTLAVGLRGDLVRVGMAGDTAIPRAIWCAGARVS